MKNSLVSEESILKKCKVTSVLSLIISILILSLAVVFTVVGFKLVFNKNDSSEEYQSIILIVLLIVIGVIVLLMAAVLYISGISSFVSAIILIISAKNSVENVYKKRKTIYFSAVVLFIISLMSLITLAVLLFQLIKGQVTLSPLPFIGLILGVTLPLILGIIEIKNLKEIKDFVALRQADR